MLRRRPLPPQPLLLVLFLLTLLTCLPHSAQGMIGRHVPLTITPEEHFTLLWSFEFEAGGTLEFDFELTKYPTGPAQNYSLQLLVIKDEQIPALQKATIDDVCSSPTFNFVDTTWQAALNANRLLAHANVTIPHRSWYRLLQLNCYGEAYQVSVSWAAKNPNGEYLSLSQVPYKKLFVYLTLIWVTLACVWAFNWFRYRGFNILLQRILTLVPISIGLQCFVYIYHWRYASVHGTFSTGLRWLTLACTAVSRMALFLGVGLIAKGWHLIYPEMEAQQQKILCGICAGVLAVFMCREVWVNLYLILALVVYICALRFVFNSLLHTLTFLVNQSTIVRRTGINVDTIPLGRKLWIFKKFQSFLVLFILFYLVFQLWAEVFLVSAPWIGDLLQNTIEAGLCVSIAYLLWMRPFNPYRYLPRPPGAQPEVHQRMNTFWWTPDMPFPDLANSSRMFGFDHVTPVIVIENPPQTGRRSSDDSSLASPRTRTRAGVIMLAVPLYDGAQPLLDSDPPQQRAAANDDDDESSDAGLLQSNRTQGQRGYDYAPLNDIEVVQMADI